LSKKDAKKMYKTLSEATRMIQSISTETQPEERVEDAALEVDEPIEDVAEPVLTEAAKELPTAPEQAIEQPIEHAPEKAPAPKPLSEAVMNWLDGMVDGDVTTLTTDDIPRVLVELKHQRGPLRSNSTIDYDRLIRERLNGRTPSQLADRFDSTPSAISQSLTIYKKKVIFMRQQKDPIIDNQTSSTPRVVKQVESTTETLAQEPLQTPKPRPPVNPGMTFQPISSSETISERRGPSAADVISLAVEKPTVVSREEWVAAAEESIKSVTAPYIEAENAEALWKYLHVDDKGEYRIASKLVQQSIEGLRPRFSQVVKQKFAKNPSAKLGLQMLFNNSMGYKNLDNIHATFEQKEYSKSLSSTERQLVLAVYELLES
jgi:hypothetical protein